MLLRIERHLRLHRMPPSRFGREALGDPCLVFDLWNGRELRPQTAARVRAYLERAEAAAREELQ